jgi:hypothetical protein
MKLIVELMMSRVMIPTKSCQSGGFPCKNQEKKTHQILRTHSSHKTRAVRISTYSSIGERDGHDGGRLHDPGQRVPHESQELEELALLQTRTRAHKSIMGTSHHAIRQTE